EALLVPEGTEEVKVNTPIARLKGEGESTAPAPPQSAAPRAPPKGEQKPPKAEQSAPVSSPPGGGVREADGGGPKPAQGAKTKAPAPPSAERAPPLSQPDRDGEDRVLASPLARRMAQQAGIDLNQVKGSGPHGRVIRRDLEGLKGAPAAKPAAAPAPAAVKPAATPAAEPRRVQSLEQQGIPAGSYDLVPLDGMKKTIARRMTDSFRDVPHFPLTIDIQLDALLAARTKINGMLEKDGVKVSVNDMIIKAAATALKRAPDANASYTPEGIAFHHHADIAVAVAIEGGLITPIVRAAETKGLAEIAREMKDLAERARTRKLKPEEFQGGTFSISNLGMFGITSFASIINEPQGAILSVGVGEKRPVVRGDQLVIATVMSVTLTCDHRVVDGAIGARWLAAFKALVEDPITMIV
ncbi:MAG TPA: 2-oxo acid dehydrogenase subunit E2, partial [Caulobacteraceae bacterium]|nr:2-oxo acid dehydrogenase subunit E2 [Caulobacteraceae bacterium]